MTEPPNTEFDNTSPRLSQPSTRLGRVWWRLVRLGFRLLYNEMAWTYDGVSWLVSMGQWRAWQRAAITHLNVPPSSLVLEIAHGTGNLQLDLAAAGYRRVALDYSPYMGRIARRKLQRKGFEAPILRAKAQAMPFEDASFDALVSTFPTPFIVEHDTLTEAHRILKHGARLVIVPNAVLTGGGVAKDTLEAAYRVTGQRAKWQDDVLARFDDAGFDLETRYESVRNSIVQVLIAQKR